MVTQITEEEMRFRLKYKEDPIDISIDKWIRLRDWIIEQYNAKELSLNDIYFESKFHGETCALCEVFICDENPHANTDEECPLSRMNNICGGNPPNSFWSVFSHAIWSWISWAKMEEDFDHVATLDEVVEAANNMIAALKACKEIKEE